MSKKYFVVADVHSYYDELQQALLEKGWDINNPDHIFVSCGDLLDRGTQSLQCLKFVNSLPKDRKILIRGNHEDLMVACLERGTYLHQDIHNGTAKTICDVTNMNREEELVSQEIESMKINTNWLTYINSCVNYAEIGNNIFVHGWIPTKTKETLNYLGKRQIINHSYKPNWRKAKNSSWKSARWLNGMKMWDSGIKEPDKTIYCGHWHCSWGNAHLHNDGIEFPVYAAPEEEYKANFTPFIDEGIVALDGCTAVSGIVNCVVIEED